MKKKNLIVSIPLERIESKILLIRGQKVMLSFHLAELYGVETRTLVQSVNRNIKRFPNDFMFQLNESEAEQVVSQNVIPHKKYFGGHLPYAFTEHGVLMLSSVLNSDRAIEINIQIMRVFTKLRKILATHKDLQKKIEEHDARIKYIFKLLNQMLVLPQPPPKQIKGFLRNKI
ncbi:MAG: ORF6N domain-containing protein [Elusimicrobia bacterium]|nr:ORF6N domain-containing protein [Elusimicrobiota bacterium]